MSTRLPCRSPEVRARSRRKSRLGTWPGWNSTSTSTSLSERKSSPCIEQGYSCDVNAAVRMPQRCLGRSTGLLAELENRNPRDEKGHRRAKHHQWLTEDVGRPALAQRLYAGIGFMRASESWQDFYSLLQRAYLKKNTTTISVRPGRRVGWRREDAAS